MMVLSLPIFYSAFYQASTKIYLRRTIRSLDNDRLRLDQQNACSLWLASGISIPGLSKIFMVQEGNLRG